MLARIPKYFSHGQHLSIWLCHDENQKHKITHEEQQNRQGTAQWRKTGLLRWQVHRIHGKNLPGAGGRGQTSQTWPRGGAAHLSIE